VVHVYVLVEHQSTSDYWMPFRVWQYIFAAWDDVRRQAEGKQVKLPLVIPLVVFNGAKTYQHSLDLRGLINAEYDLIDRVLFKPVRSTSSRTRRLSERPIWAQCC